MSILVGLYGAGGCGRGVMPLVRADSRWRDARLVFVDDGRTGAVNGHDVLSFAQFVEQPAARRVAVLAVADGLLRERLDLECADKGVEVAGVAADNVVVMDDVEVAPGAILSPFVTLTSNIRIGRCFHANLYSYVEHDCRIGDYVTFAPGVRCNGNVHIGDHAYVGAGAVIRQGKTNSPLKIGAGATIGMGAVVTRDVAPGETVVGNPARPIARNG